MSSFSSPSVCMLTQKAREETQARVGKTILGRFCPTSWFACHVILRATDTLSPTHPSSVLSAERRNLSLSQTHPSLLASCQLQICALRLHLQLRRASKGTLQGRLLPVPYPSCGKGRLSHDSSDAYDSRTDGSSWPLCCQEYMGH